MIRAMTKFITREKDTTVSKGTGNSETYELRSRKKQSQKLPNEETGTWDENSSQEMIVDRLVIFKDQTFEVQVTENKDYTKPDYTKPPVHDEREHGENVYKVGVDSKF